jgi:acetoacetyl-CoA synthetase
MDRRQLADHSIPAIARRNVRAMREVDPTGPYRLLGYSFGGTVALEMAAQLVAAGAAVELLALLEPSLARQRPSWVAHARGSAARVRDRAVEAHPGRDAQASLARADAIVRAGVAYVRRGLAEASTGVVTRRGLAQHDAFLQLHSRLLRRHRPQPYRGDTVVFASPNYLERAAPVLDALLPPEGVGGRRRDVPVAGAHLDLVREPNIAEVARGLADRLGAVSGRSGGRQT